METLNITFVAEKLRTAREKAGLTQREAAAIAGVTVSNISNYETGGCLPSLMVFFRLTYAYKKSPLFFVEKVQS